MGVQTSRLLWREGSDAGCYRKNCQNCRVIANQRAKESKTWFRPVIAYSACVLQHLPLPHHAKSTRGEEGARDISPNGNLAKEKVQAYVLFSGSKSLSLWRGRAISSKNDTNFFSNHNWCRLGFLASFHRMLSSRFSLMCHFLGAMGAAAILVLWKVSYG